jgi:hypothetical protein
MHDKYMASGRFMDRQDSGSGTIDNNQQLSRRHIAGYTQSYTILRKHRHSIGQLSTVAKALFNGAPQTIHCPTNGGLVATTTT